MTINDLKVTSKNVNENGGKVKIKNNLKGGSVHENVEISDEYLDENLQNNNFQMDLAMQILSSNKTVRNDTIQDLKDFNSQSLTTRAKKGEQLVSMMPAIKKAFDLIGDVIVELSTENGTLKTK